MKPSIVFRADGNAAIGLGHVIRSLALVQLLQNDFHCHFLIRGASDALRQQISSHCQMTELSDIPPDQEAIQVCNRFLNGREIVVLDGYHFDTTYQRQIRQKGSKLVCIDDMHQHHFVADAIINHSPGVRPEHYSHETWTRCCLGPSYSLLRPAFREASQSTRYIDRIDQLFICFGGADSQQLSLRALEAISGQALGLSAIHVVLGSANQSVEKVKAFASITNENILVYQNLKANEMVELMQECHLAIVPSSSILYEVMAVQMPAITGYYVDNQCGLYAGFCQLGGIHGIGDFTRFDNYVEAIWHIREQGALEYLKAEAHTSIAESGQQLSQLFHSLNPLVLCN
ncbi:MAG: UDP-2,4-diacetamido-2,4,6-trideoxy-beta-L-altropyranose hydrolase [Bacteroidota bacterium]